MSRKLPDRTPHDEALAIVVNLVTKNLEGDLEATAACNQCGEELTINLVTGATSVRREKLVGSVRPDISLLDASGEAVRFIEVVDSHAPEATVHEQALRDGTEVVGIHRRAEREFTGRRRNTALDASLTVKTRLQELADGRIVRDAHNLLCRKPKCTECGAPRLRRTVTVRTTDCWTCGQTVTVATGDNDGESLEHDQFTKEEIAFARAHGVTLERRFSATVGGKSLANVCLWCDPIQGNWFLYMDPYHDRFKLHKVERKGYGPCDPCTARYCVIHGKSMDSRGDIQGPTCLEESERGMCPHKPDRDCFYPRRCEEDGCYFVSRAIERRDQLAQEQQRQRKREEQRDHETRQWARLNEWLNENRETS